jgi:hypothetical protein
MTSFVAEESRPHFRVKSPQQIENKVILEKLQVCPRNSTAIVIHGRITIAVEKAGQLYLYVGRPRQPSKLTYVRKHGFSNDSTPYRILSPPIQN